MNDDEYFMMDEDEDQDSGYITDYTSEEDSQTESENEGDSAFDETEESANKSSNKSLSADKDGNLNYGDKFTKFDAELLQGYDDIVKASKDRNGAKEAFNITDATICMITANPKHVSGFIRSKIARNLLNLNGKNRIVSTVYSPQESMSGEDLEDELEGGGDYSLNRKYSEEAKETMTRFVDYLANRKLENDSPLARRYKQMDIPALIIFLFTNNMYSLIIDCPTMPEYYAKQIEEAFNKLLKSKYDIVEQLASKYDSVGRPQVAERVRKLKFAWFEREPADLRVRREFSDLGITYDDIQIYREYRSKFLNVSKSITQESISDMIEVKMDNGVYKKLKDKTRFLAITRVKDLYKNWAKEYNANPEVVKDVVFKR